MVNHIYHVCSTSNMLCLLLPQKMVILCAGHVAPSVHSNFLPGWLLLNNSPRMYCNTFLDEMKLKRRNRSQWVTTFSKGSSLQGTSWPTTCLTEHFILLLEAYFYALVSSMFLNALFSKSQSIWYYHIAFLGHGNMEFSTVSVSACIVYCVNFSHY